MAHGIPLPPDPTEPVRVAKLCRDLGIQYLVLTSVDRDDLEDGRAGQFRDVIHSCRAMNPSMRFEILVPDFKGVQERALDILEEARPFVFSHNVETVPALYGTARPGGEYRRSLGLLEMAALKWPDTPVKTSLMLGLGETEGQVRDVLRQLRDAGCDRLCLGQYLRPSRQSLKVAEFIHPDTFRRWKAEAEAMGFSRVVSEPFARSSYHAQE